jgi:acylphosphatase
LSYIYKRKPNIRPSKIQFKVTGKVQGVCFRSFTAEKAEGLNLTGHVKNESDGSVCYLDVVRLCTMN